MVSHQARYLNKPVIPSISVLNTGPFINTLRAKLIVIKSFNGQHRSGQE